MATICLNPERRHFLISSFQNQLTRELPDLVAAFTRLQHGGSPIDSCATSLKASVLWVCKMKLPADSGINAQIRTSKFLEFFSKNLEDLTVQSDIHHLWNLPQHRETGNLFEFVIRASTLLRQRWSYRFLWSEALSFVLATAEIAESVWCPLPVYFLIYFSDDPLLFFSLLPWQCQGCSILS